MSLDRLNETNQVDFAKPQVTMNGAVYIRSEYFEDGQRIFFSPLDFAVNGPDEGSVVARKYDKYGGQIEHSVKVLRKHYERGSDIPCMVEVEVSSIGPENYAYVDKEPLWVIVRATKTTIDKFNLVFQGQHGHSFALVPNVFLEKKVRMNSAAPNNSISAAFSHVTGIPKEYLIVEDMI